MRMLNKNRSEILAEVEAKGKSLRDTETQLKLARNEMELQDNQVKTLETKNKELGGKVDSLEAALQERQDKIYQLEKDREQKEVDAQNKIEILQYKLLSKLDNSAGEGEAGSQSGEAFKELLSLCRQDLETILTRL